MKIDSHQHFWQYNTSEYSWIGNHMKVIRRDFSPDDLSTELFYNGFDGSIAVQARQTPEETAWLLSLASQYPHIKGVIGWIDLSSADAEQLIKDYAAHPKAVGLRHVLQDEPDDYFMLRPAFVEGVQLLQQHQLTYDLLVLPKHLPNTIEFIGLFGEDQRFVLDHIAKPHIREGVIAPWKAAITELAKYPNLYCKLSGIVTEADWNHWTPEHIKPYLDVVFDVFGPDRLIIGSDWPVCLLAGTYTEVIGIIHQYIAEFSDTDKNKILGGNALKAYPRLNRKSE